MSSIRQLRRRHLAEVRAAKREGREPQALPVQIELEIRRLGIDRWVAFCEDSGVERINLLPKARGHAIRPDSSLADGFSGLSASSRESCGKARFARSSAPPTNRRLQFGQRAPEPALASCCKRLGHPILKMSVDLRRESPSPYGGASDPRSASGHGSAAYSFGSICGDTSCIRDCRNS